MHHVEVVVDVRPRLVLDAGPLRCAVPLIPVPQETLDVLNVALAFIRPDSATSAQDEPQTVVDAATAHVSLLASMALLVRSEAIHVTSVRCYYVWRHVRHGREPGIRRRQSHWVLADPQALRSRRGGSRIRLERGTW